MRIRQWLIILATFGIQISITESIPQDGQFGWSWEMQTPSSNPTTGQYYVRLPQSEQRVLYSAGDTGYHGAVSVSTNGEHSHHQATFALGSHALNLLRDQNAPRVDQNKAQNPNEQSQQVSPQHNAVDIFLLPQPQFTAAPIGPNHIVDINNLQQPELQLGNDYFHVPNTQYFIQHPQNVNNYQNQQNNGNNYQNNGNNHQNQQSNGNNDIINNINKDNDSQVSTPLEDKEVKSENFNDKADPILQVFKDHECVNEQHDSKRKVEININPTAFRSNINGNYGLRSTERPSTKYDTFSQREQQRKNSRSERVYPILESLLFNRSRENGINKLVESTQDLITNEDLLTINHAAEKHLVQNDDVIKPNNKFELTPAQTASFTSRFLDGRSEGNMITVKAKLGQIVGSDIEQVENNQSEEQILQRDSDQYDFALPIVVQDSTMSDYKEQVIKSVMSSVAPYLDAGYEIGNVRNSDIRKFIEHQRYSGGNSSFIDITPRPIGQKYLAPITVGLRLLNSNDSEIFNTVDDHEYSDSELISETVKHPVREKTIVEIQESIPLETIHINDVEVHEYMEDGKPNHSDDNSRRYLYNQYMNALESSRKIQENMNENLYKYGTMKEEQSDDSKELQTSENIQSEVKINANGQNQRKDFLSGFKHLFPNRIIQPVVIEKEVPVTQYVDRVVEKPVPYPQPVEVVKEVPVDKLTVLPVPVEKIVEKPFEVTKYVDKPFRVDVPQPFPIEIRVPYPVEQKVYIDRPVHIPYPVEKVVEKQVVQPVPVPTPVAVPYAVEKRVPYPVTVEKAVPYAVQTPVETIVEKKVPVPYPVEKRVPYPVPYETKVPVPYLVEKRVPYPVEKIVEKPVPVTQIVEREVEVKVPVPQPYPVHIRYPQPYPVETIVEKKVPYPVHVDRVVEKKVPYPVETVVEKVVEKPVEVTKYVDRPYPVEKRVPYAVETIVEKKVPYPVPVRVPYPVEQPVYNNHPGPQNYPLSAPSQNLAQYHKYTAEQHKLGIPPPHLQSPQQQYLQHMEKQLQQHYYQKQQEQNLKQQEQHLKQQEQHIKQQEQHLKQQEQMRKAQYLKHQEQLRKAEYLKQQEQYLNKLEQMSKDEYFKHQEQLRKAEYLKQQEQQRISNYNQIPQYIKNQEKPKVQSVRWGNLYASSYQYINNTEHKIPEFKKTPLLTKYLNYVTNKNHQSPRTNYYGPPPTQSASYDWSGDENRRTDRTPRMTQLRIEYGFKPPMIPSIEVDLDGIPVENKGDSTTS